jgi:aspartate aminotransferase
MPQVSEHFAGRKPSAIRQAQIHYLARPDRDRVHCVNVAIGNVTLPMHPRMQERMRTLGEPGSPFAGGTVSYSPSVGTDEARRAFLRIIASGGFPTKGLEVLVTDGGSLAMELMILGVCGPASSRPLLLIDPAYTNYIDMAKRSAVRTVSVCRSLGEKGSFAPPDLAQLEVLIQEENCAGMVVIPSDNPTGQFLDQKTLVELARLAVRYDIWLIGDEAYRQLQYGAAPASSIWGIGDEEVPGIRGRRISIETASKVWNACGLRIGALVTDSPEFHAKAVAEFTANLCANTIGQWIFGALAHESDDDLRGWYDRQRSYYRALLEEVRSGLVDALPGLVASAPEAALYSVIDVRNIAAPGFDAAEFVSWCAKEGSVVVDGVPHTLLVAPMGGFHARRPAPPESRTQMRIAFVEPAAEMRKVPALFSALFRAWQEKRAKG